MRRRALIIVSVTHGRECRVGTGFIVPTRMARWGQGDAGHDEACGPPYYSGWIEGLKWHKG
jgi:hypothetical protein